MEATHQDMHAPGSGGDSVHEGQDARLVNATLNENFAVAFAPSWEHLTSTSSSCSRTFETGELPLKLSYFDESGFFGSIKGSYVVQDGTDVMKNFKDDFFILDAALGYRFPDQRGIAVLEVRNLLDEDFGFAERTLIQDFTAEPRFAPTGLSCSVSLFAFDTPAVLEPAMKIWCAFASVAAICSVC